MKCNFLFCGDKGRDTKPTETLGKAVSAGLITCEQNRHDSNTAAVQHGTQLLPRDSVQVSDSIAGVANAGLDKSRTMEQKGEAAGDVGRLGEEMQSSRAYFQGCLSWEFTCRSDYIGCALTGEETGFQKAETLKGTYG